MNLEYPEIEVNRAAPLAWWRSAWTAHLVVLGVLVLLLGIFNAQAIEAAVGVWWVSPTFSHCFLVIPVSGYFVWRKRRALAAMTPAAFPRALWLAPPLVLFLLAGTLAHINEAEQFALIGLLQVLILAVLGLEVYRKILFPSLFLFFLVPTGGYLIAPLQSFTTHFINVGLNLLGIPHYTEGYVIELTNGDYQVAEACAGLRFLIATIAVGVLFAHLTYRKWYKIALFLFACMTVPVIANGFRALGIILIAHWSDNKIAHGADHIVYGWGFLVAILLVLMFIGTRFADPIPEEGEGKKPVAVPERRHAFALAIALTLVAISFVPSVLYWQNHKPVTVDEAGFSAPIEAVGWSMGPPSDGWSPSYAAPDARLDFAMREAGAPDIDVFVNYYATGHGKHNLITSTNTLWKENIWHPLSEGTAEAVLDGRMVHLGETVIASGGITRIIWWTYWSDGRFTTSGVDVKLDRLRGAFSGGHGSALVAVSTTVETSLDDARARLRAALGSLGAIETRLKQAGRN